MLLRLTDILQELGLRVQSTTPCFGKACLSEIDTVFKTPAQIVGLKTFLLARNMKDS